MAKKSDYFFYQTGGHISTRSFSPCATANHSLDFFVLQWWLLPCCVTFQDVLIKCFFAHFLQHFHKVLCCSSGIDLHLSHQSTFIHETEVVPLPYQFDDWVVLLHLYFCIVLYHLYKWTMYCSFRSPEIFPQGSNFLWSRVVWLNFPIMWKLSNKSNRCTSKWWLKWCWLACEILLAMIWR